MWSAHDGEVAGPTNLLAPPPGSAAGSRQPPIRGSASACRGRYSEGPATTTPISDCLASSPTTSTVVGWAAGTHSSASSKTPTTTASSARTSPADQGPERRSPQRASQRIGQPDSQSGHRQPRWSLVSDLAGRLVFPQPEIGVVCTFASKRGLIVTPTAQHDQTGGEDPEQQRGHGRPVRVGGRVSRVCGCPSNVIVIVISSAR